MQEAQDIQGRRVLMPAEEAYATLYDALRRLAWVLLAALIFAVFQTSLGRCLARDHATAAWLASVP